MSIWCAVILAVGFIIGMGLAAFLRGALNIYRDEERGEAMKAWWDKVVDTIPEMMDAAIEASFKTIKRMEEDDLD